MKPTKRTRHNIAVALSMRAANATYAEIAAHFGISETSARMWTDLEYYTRHKEQAAKWTKEHPEKHDAWMASKKSGMTEADRTSRNARQRGRYVAGLKYQAMFRRLAEKHAEVAQGFIAEKIRKAMLGFSDRITPTFETFMAAMTGVTRAEFAERFNREGELEYIVPLCAFDLTKPEHVVRACHVSNVRLVSKGMDRTEAYCGSVMSLPWVEKPEALVMAQTFISRQLTRLEAWGRWHPVVIEGAADAVTDPAVA